MASETPTGPFLSVIVAAYDSQATIAETIESLLAQTSDDWELIVVDDGSTDSTGAVADGFAAKDPRIRVVHQTNAGTAIARNAGAALASGTYWCFLDADDMLLPMYVEAQAAFIGEHPGYDIYSCNGRYLLRDGGSRTVWRGAEFSRPFSLSAADQFAHSSILLMATITPRVFEMTGGFRTLHSEDYDFWLRALISGARHLYNPAEIAVYRRAEGSRTRDLEAEAHSFLEIQREALETPGLTEEVRTAGREAVAFSEARVLRRELEAALFAHDYRHARSRYLGAAKAFPDTPKYVFGLAIMMLSPRLYARIKARRMI